MWFESQCLLMKQTWSCIITLNSHDRYLLAVRLLLAVLLLVRLYMGHAVDEIMLTLETEATVSVTMQLQYIRHHKLSTQIALYSRMSCKLMAPDVDTYSISMNTLMSCKPIVWSAQSEGIGRNKRRNSCIR